jgi:predicted N-acetyltransferase YhbS
MTKNEINIRPLRQQDIDAVIKLHRELGWNPAFQADGTTLLQRLKALTAEENSLLLVAEMNKHVIGYVHGEIITHLLFAGREMYISEVFVKEKHRGSGVGRELMSAIENESVKQRCFRISVLNSRERESYKRQFYPSLGYEERTQTALFTKRVDWG